MADLIKIIAVLTVLVLLLRKKLNFGAVMLVGAVMLGLLYRTPPQTFLTGVFHAVLAPTSLEMTAALVFTMIIENILRTTGTLKRMVESLGRILPDARLIMAAMPAMIGMLPSPGGAVFSAPMVKEASARFDIKPDQQAFINYWYRHIWEYVSPLYPGMILVAGLTRLPFQRLALANASFAVAVVLLGALFCFTGIPTGIARQQTTKDCAKLKALLTFLAAIAPILLTLVLVVLLQVNVVAAMGGVTVALYVIHRYSPARIWESLRQSVSIKALFLVLGIMVFKEILEVSLALNGLSTFFSQSGFPLLLVLTLIPFLAGVMTGLTIAFVGITFPILLPLMGNGSPSLGMLALAFGSGFAGVMLSPVHLCLVLTREYFEADLAKVYRRLWVPSALVLATAVIPLYFFR
jgi:integral membrane protein (TIGR00529 family)